MKDPRPKQRRGVEASALATHAPAYPTRGAAPIDPSRRRFLRQVGAGAGAAGFLATVGLPQLAHGQSMAVDFSVLEAHPPTAAPIAEAPAVAAPAPSAPAPSAALGALAAPPAPRPAPPAAAASPAEAAEASAGEPLAQANDEAFVEITENRALWLEAGYLVLLRWVRRDGDQVVVAALEGSTAAVGELLQREVQATSDLHNLDRLHAIEAALVGLLEPLVAPARIEALHLNHDCNVVCGGLDAGTPPDHIPLAGVAPPTIW